MQTLLIGMVLCGSVMAIAAYFLLFRLQSALGTYSTGVTKTETKVEAKADTKFKALIQFAQDLITIVDDNGIILYQSPACEKLLGYTPDQLVNQSMLELMHGEDQSLLKYALSQQTAFSFEYRAQHKDGSWMYFEAVGSNLKHNPNIGGIVINSRDITDRKRGEEEKKQKELAAIRFSVEKERAEREKQIIEEGKKQLEIAYSKLDEAKKEIENLFKEVTDSINYAFRIQTALLPPAETLLNYLPHSFILWRPAHTVSGDFYWHAKVGSQIIVIAADCTGHGVPGAFMTMIGNTLVNQVVLQEGITAPDQILNRLHILVRKALKQDQPGSTSRDGMDVSLATIDTSENKLYWAGANNPLIQVRGNEAIEIKADKVPIGGLQTEAERIFTCHTIDYQPGDTYYLYSDGFQDQFGGDKGRKYMTKRFKEFLSKMALEIPDMSAQKQRADKEITDWMGNKYHQIDDITLIGFRL